MSDKQTSNKNSDPGLAARQAALGLINGVLVDQRLMAELTGDKGPLARLPVSEQARAQRLATSALRWLDRSDRALGPFLQRRPTLEVHNILRLALAEVFAEGAPAHAVVNSAVSLARQDKWTAHSAGLVNAVLRRVIEKGPDAWAALPLPRLPKWLRKPLIADYGKATIEQIEAAHAAGAPLDLTLKPDAKPDLPDATLLPTGSLRLRDAGQVSALVGFDEGTWWVQDAAAALPAIILNAQAGETVLDMCAAPGGKAMQLAATGATVTALDISESRMKRVHENLDRIGLSAEIVVEDALEFSGGPYDAILLDAPCTATGTIRRHPDLPYAKDGGDFPELFALQERMIDHALTLLKPNGRLIFCTCSLLFDEGEIQIDDALKRHKTLRTDPDALKITGVDPDWIDDAGCMRVRPDMWADLGGMDGFFIAVLRKGK